MSAIKLDLSETLRWREAIPQCVKMLRKQPDDAPQEALVECVILNLLQVLGGHIVEEEIGQPVLAMGDGLYMPRDEAERLSEMATSYEIQEGLLGNGPAQGMPREATRREGGSGASAPASPVTK